MIIYPSEEGNIQIDVQLENETVWLTQDQMGQLFNKARSTINEHIKNIYGEQELLESETKRKFGNSEFSDKPTNYYSLDVIISVGYRVKSPEGTQFRIWANKVLKEYLVKGYVINEQKVRKQAEQLEELKNTVKLLSNVVDAKALNSDEATGLLKVLTDYSYALDILDQYDHQVLDISGTTTQDLFQISYDEAMSAIHSLRDKFGGSSLFGNEKDESFQGSLAAIYQTFDVSFYTRAWKKKLLTFYISSSRIILSVMETNASPPFFLSGSLRKTGCYIKKPASCQLRTMHCLH